MLHYQYDAIDARLVEFMVAEDSDKWVRRLYAEFERFFLDSLPIREILEQLSGMMDAEAKNAASN